MRRRRKILKVKEIQGFFEVCFRYDKKFSRPPRYDRFDNPPGMDAHLVFQSAFVILSHKYSFVKALCLYVCRFMQKYNTYRPEMKKQIS